MYKTFQPFVLGSRITLGAFGTKAETEKSLKLLEISVLQEFCATFPQIVCSVFFFLYCCIVPQGNWACIHNKKQFQKDKQEVMN